MLDDNLTLKIVDQLAEGNTNQTKIKKVLEEVMRYFSFEAGMIYEVDQYNIFNLKEYVINEEIEVLPSFSLKEITKEAQLSLKEARFMIFKEENNSLTHFFKKIFNASLVVVYPVVDETQQILGFLIFYNVRLATFEFSTELLAILKRVFLVLGKYTSCRMYENKLSFAVRSLESVLDNTGIDIYVNDFYTHEILYVNKSMAAPYGGQEVFMGRKCWDVLFPDKNGPCEFCPQLKLTDADGNLSKVYTWDYQRPFDGSWFRVFSAAFRWVDGRLAHVVSSADITDNKNYEALIHHMANYDTLTDLPNRRMLLEECERRINNNEVEETGYVLFFDIDGFKKINDNFGHESGDEFLIQLGAYFLQIPLLKDSVYRNGGDEFIAVINGETTSKENILQLCNEIKQRFKEPWYLKEGEVHCAVSIGISCYPEDGNNAEALIHKADLAMYQAKKHGGAQVCFACELDK